MSISRSLLIVGTLACLFSPNVGFARALIAPPPTIAQRVIRSPIIVVGKVVSIEEQTVDAPFQPGAPEKTPYHIALIKISDPIAGAQGLTHVRVGFIRPLPPKPVPVDPNQPAISRPIRGPGFGTPALTVNQEACFFLQKHHESDFLVIPPMFFPVDKQTPTFAKDLETVKQTLQIIADPMKALRSADAAVRLEAALTLVQYYRTYPPTFTGKEKVIEEAISAEESKLILAALAEADFAKRGPRLEMGPMQAVGMLAISEKDGLRVPRFTGQEDYDKIVAEAYRSFLKEKADSFRIKRFVEVK